MQTRELSRALIPRGMLEASVVADIRVASAMVKGRGKITYIVFRGRGKITCNLLGAGEITYDLGGGSNTLFFKATALKKNPQIL